MVDAALAPIQDTIRAAASAQRPLVIRGGGTKAFYGGAATGDALETRALAGIVDYPPTELVITARAGTLLAEIEEAMQAQGQMLAFEPPRFAPGGTLGGAIAAGLSGPRRPYAGAVRDFVLGVRVIDGTGEDLRFGGRVMKNVAGFDVSRLMTGALGTLGVITEVSLKCLPLPQTEATRVLTASAADSISLVNGWAGKPLPLSATCHHDGRLWVRLSGATPAVEAAAKTIGGSECAAGSEPWVGVRDHTHPFFVQARDRAAPLWRLSVKSTTPFADLGGEQLIEWGGALRWLAAGEKTETTRVREWAAAHGGHATLFRSGDTRGGAFAPLDATALTLHRRLKAAFDPHGILNRGRLYPEF
jgi:glycolate dehydrogenase FAD-binding subunit